MEAFEGSDYVPPAFWNNAPARGESAKEQCSVTTNLREDASKQLSSTWQSPSSTRTNRNPDVNESPGAQAMSK